MTRDEYVDFCLSLDGAAVDAPFNEDFDTLVARHGDSRKWFALIMKLDGREVVNLKCDPMEADFLRNAYEGISEAWHMNKVHWNSVWLESDVPDAEIRRQTAESFRLTGKKPRRRQGEKKP